jgi:sialic acid synthase
VDRKSTTLVAEIGCVHGGSLDRAIDLIRLAAAHGAHAVKSQKRNPMLCVPEAQRHQPHPEPRFAFGSTYFDHRVALELSPEDHQSMADECHRLGIMYGCSVWDIDSLHQMNKVSMDFVKIPSACCLDNNLVYASLNSQSLPVHISNGMTSFDNRVKLYGMLKGYSHRVVVYHTTSEYPCPFNKLYLLEIEKLVSLGFEVGFSNHGYGIAADIAAMALGASWIERHFVDDRTYPHTDAAASLEPHGLMTLRRDIDHVGQSLQNKPDAMTEEESRQERKLRR